MIRINGKPPTEDQEQMRVVVYLQKKNILHYAVWNGGNKSMTEAIRAKRMGLVSGVPDICVPIPRGGFCGLYLELKRLKGGVLSDNQAYWIEALRNQKYRVEVCRGADAAIEVIEDYFNGKSNINYSG